MSNPPASPRTTRLTSRAAVLAVVICAIALSLAYPVREYLAQRQQIDQLVAQQQTMLTQVKNLQAEQAKLSDRSYIEQLARQELDMCFPGTQCYVVEGSQPLANGTPRPSRRGPRPGTRSCGSRCSRPTRARRERRHVITARDAAVIAAQLGRLPRGLLAVAHRCPCGLPDVAETAPRLPDGSPFPTLYYLTCPRASAGGEQAGSQRD